MSKPTEPPEENKKLEGNKQKGVEELDEEVGVWLGGD